MKGPYRSRWKKTEGDTKQKGPLKDQYVDEDLLNLWLLQYQVKISFSPDDSWFSAAHLQLNELVSCKEHLCTRAQVEAGHFEPLRSSSLDQTRVAPSRNINCQYCWWFESNNFCYLWSLDKAQDIFCTISNRNLHFVCNFSFCTCQGPTAWNSGVFTY